MYAPAMGDSETLLVGDVGDGSRGRLRPVIAAWLQPRATHAEARRRELILTAFLVALLGIGMVAGLVLVVVAVSGGGVRPVALVGRFGAVVAWLAGIAWLLREVRCGRLWRAAVGGLALLATAGLGLAATWSVMLPATICISVLFVALAAVLLEGRTSYVAIGGYLAALLTIDAAQFAGAIGGQVDWLAEPRDAGNSTLIFVVLAALAATLLVLNRELRTPIGELVSVDPQHSPLARSRTRELTVRETEVTMLLAEGKKDSEIAEELFISARTVNTHVANALRKTGCTNRTELGVLAVREGIVPLVGTVVCTEPSAAASSRTP